jgi:AraC-like DNA-binding protein
MSETFTPQSTAHSLPAVHALHIAEVVRRWDVSPEELFAGLHLDAKALDAPEARLPIATVEAIVARARQLTGEAALGFFLGLQMRISAHGYLGFAAMTAATVRDALALAVQFAPTRTTALAVRVQVEGDVASVIVDERADFGTARDVVLFALLVGIWQIGQALTARALTGSAEVMFAEPPYMDRFARFAPPVRFGQPANRLVFDASVLDLPLTMADPAAMRLARDQCERELDALGLGGNVAGRVRGLIAKKEGGFRSLEEIAAEMHVSARTMKRKLAMEGLAYSELLEEQQRDRALLLLRTPSIAIDEVAARVGYSDAANFSRAFRRWTGMTPAAFRRSGR